jgi:hypothetical protein
MAVYLRGLLSETERKNGWTLAEAVGDGGPQGMQRLLNFYAWDADGVRDDVAAVVAEAWGDAERGVLIVDLCRHRDYAERSGVGAGQRRLMRPGSRHNPGRMNEASFVGRTLEGGGNDDRATRGQGQPPGSTCTSTSPANSGP